MGSYSSGSKKLNEKYTNRTAGGYQPDAGLGYGTDGIVNAGVWYKFTGKNQRMANDKKDNVARLLFDTLFVTLMLKKSFTTQTITYELPT